MAPRSQGAHGSQLGLRLTSARLLPSPPGPPLARCPPPSGSPGCVAGRLPTWGWALAGTACTRDTDVPVSFHGWPRRFLLRPGLEVGCACVGSRFLPEALPLAKHPGTLTWF